VDDLTEKERKNWKNRGKKGTKIRQPFYGIYFDENDTKVPRIIGLAEGSVQSQKMFRQEMLNEPHQIDLMPLRKELWKFYDYSPQILRSFQKRIMGVDLSGGGTKKSDWQALAVFGRFRDQSDATIKYCLLDGSLTRLNLVSAKTATANQDSLARRIGEFCLRYHVDILFIETNGMQGLFLNALTAVLKNMGVKTWIVTRVSTGKKESRIVSTFGIIVQGGKFLVRSDWLHQDGYREFCYQIDSWTSDGSSVHDDAPDSCNIAIYWDQEGLRKRM
jgi:hypothetical protein